MYKCGITDSMMRRWYRGKCRIINFKGKYRFTDSMMRRTEWRIRDCFSRISWTVWVVFEFNQDKLRYQFIRPNCHFRHLRNFIVISTRPLNSQRSQCTNSRRPRRWHSRIGFPRNCNIVSEMLVVTNDDGDFDLDEVYMLKWGSGRSRFLGWGFKWSIFYLT